MSMKVLHEKMDKKIGIIVYDYEGYGFSGGDCSEKNCYNDLAFMIKYAIDKMHVKKENLFLVGQSLGTGIVVDFCSVHHWTTPVILISPYKSIARVMLDPHWIDITTNYVVDSIDMFTSHQKLDNVKCPIIIYHGLRDEMILPYHSKDMYLKHKDKITLVFLKKASHNGILEHINFNQWINIMFR
jgi:pimeloyl-ACP methyl ester carboxylesterase